MAYLERAVTRLEAAAHIVPNDPEILYWMALGQIDLRPYVANGDGAADDQRARELLERVRSLDANLSGNVAAKYRSGQRAQ